MNIQETHESIDFLEKQSTVVLVCDGVTSPANIGGLFRVSDAFGVREIIFCNTTIDIKSSRLKRTARNTELTSKFKISEKNTLLEIKKLQKENFKAIALEITSQSIDIRDLKFQKEEKIALIIGNERHGISAEILETVSLSTHIEMHGKNSSMNVVQATAIALFALT